MLLVVILLSVLLTETAAVTWHKLDNLEYYVARNDSKNFDGSRSVCAGMNATLAKVNSSKIYTFLKNLAVPNKGFYIGLKRIASGGELRWLDGTALVYQAWGRLQPDNHGGIDDCVTMGIFWSTSLLWYDIPCGITFGYICQRSLGYVTTTSAAGLKTTALSFHPTTANITSATASYHSTKYTMTQSTHQSEPALSTNTHNVERVDVTTQSQQTEILTTYCSCCESASQGNTPIALLVAALVIICVQLVVVVYYRMKLQKEMRYKPALQSHQELQMQSQYANVDLVVEERNQNAEYCKIGDVISPQDMTLYQNVPK